MSKKKHHTLSLATQQTDGQRVRNIRGYPSKTSKRSQAIESSIGIEMPIRSVVSNNASMDNVNNIACIDNITNVNGLGDPMIPLATEVEIPDNSANTRDPGTSRWRVSVHQLEFLAHCMEQFPPLALSRAKSREALQHSQRKWTQIAAALNKIDPRVVKTGRGWLRYWTDLKFKIRRKYQFSKRSGIRAVRLTPFERRLLRVLTDAEGNLLCGGQGQYDQDDEYPMTDEDEDSQPVPTEQVDVLSAPEVPPNVGSPNCTPAEDPIGVEKKSIENLQADILQFNLTRQREMHILEMEHKKERHKLEMEILELKKKRLIQEFDRNRQLCITLQQNGSFMS